MNWWSACVCDAHRNCISGWIVPTLRKHEWKNYCSARGCARRRVRPAARHGRRRKNSGMLQDVLKQIEQRERFVLTSHARPDGDAVGSALACCQILRALGKHADVVLHDGVPRIYRALPFADEVLQSNTVSGSYEAAIILNVTAFIARGWKVWKIDF